MSNKKTLLNEGTIRRFMKLANMGNLAENYLENYDLEEGKHDEDEEEVEEGMRLGKEDDEVEEGMYAAKQDDDEPAMRDLDEEEEMELDDIDAEMDEPMDTPEDEGAAPDEAMVKKLVDAIAVAIEGATGVEVAVEGGEEEMPMDDEPMDDEPMDDEPMDDMGEPEMEEPMGDEEPAMRDDVMEDDQFDAYIAEVTKRVAKRIIKSKLSK
jgi:hypothetical protein